MMASEPLSAHISAISKGAAGKAKAEEKRDEAETTARQLAAVTQSRIAAPIVGVDPEYLRGNPDFE